MRALAFALAFAAVAASPWSTFKHDVQRTGRSSIAGAQTNTVKWFRKLKKFGLQAPLAIAANATIYSGSASGALYAFRPDGTIKWRRDLTKLEITAGVTVARDGTLYAVSEDGILRALDARGHDIWSFDLGAYAGPSATPLVGPDGTIYAGAKIFHAIAPDGTPKWSYDTGAPINGAAAMAKDGTLYFPSGGYLYALDSSGAFLWRALERHGSSLGSAPAVGKDGTIYVNTNDGTLHAFAPDGSLKWTFDTPGIVADVPPSPALAKDGTIYFGGGGEYQEKGGYFYAVHPDGSLKWKFLAHCDQTAATVGGDGTIYFASDYCGAIRALNPDGTVKWAYFNIFDYARSAPVIGSDGTVYAGMLGGPSGPDEGGLIAFGP